jgi:hypothetical protein
MAQASGIDIMSTRIAHGLSLLCAAAIVAVLLYSIFGGMPMIACGNLARGYQPIIAFELARSLGDVQAIFGHGASLCRETLNAAFARENFTDNYLFIPAYSLFLIFFFIGARSRDPFLAMLSIAIVIVAALGDWVENSSLAQIAASPDAPPAQALTLLHYATSTKWLALGIAGFVGGLILGQKGGIANNLAFVICSAGLLLTGLGISYSAVLGPQITTAILLSWMIFLIVDVREIFRGAAS